jgi:two-component system LytT family response regulator
MIRTVVVDDEPLSRDLLRTMLEQERDVSLVGEFADGKSAVDGIRETQPDLLFLDIQMPEQDGFAVLAELGDHPIRAVIFVTAYDQYAIKAFEVHALDYLLKPFDEDRFASAMRHARERLAKPDSLDTGQRLVSLLEQLSAGGRYRDHLIIREEGRSYFQPVREIEWVEADGKYVNIHTAGGSRTMRATMMDVEQKLNPRRFTRISRSAIVNVDRIREVSPWFNGEFVVTLKSGAEVPTTRGYREAVLELLGRK